MNGESKKIQRTYVNLTVLSTFASSFIWGINTLFLLDAGLSITQAFAANAFFTLGQVIFEVPTGVVADAWGRRISYLLGTATLFISTILYLAMWQLQAPFLFWAISSAMLGLGFTFFSGAVEAWLVDALNHTKYTGSLESIFAKGQIAGGIAMLTGSIAGGLIAQLTNLGTPYILRSVLLGATFITALFFMRDVGFTPENGLSIKEHAKKILKSSYQNGLRKREIRWVMLTSPFTFGVSAFGFYAMQPYLLELYGDPEAYGVAGLAASIVAGAQIVGGLLVNKIRKQFKRRTNAMILGTIVSTFALFMIGYTMNFSIAIIMLVLWAASFAAVGPIRQAYLNKLIKSEQRATVLSFDALLGSSGAVVSQPGLGKVADVWSYSAAYMVSSVFSLAGISFLVLARKEHAPADDILTSD